MAFYSLLSFLFSNFRLALTLQTIRFGFCFQLINFLLIKLDFLF